MLRDDLLEEIDKWTDKLDQRLEVIQTVDEAGEKILENARAYRGDSEHFLEEDNLIESFEALIWAWAFVEIGENLGHLESSE